MADDITREEVRNLQNAAEAIFYALVALEERLPNPNNLPPAGTLPAITDEHVERVLVDEGYIPRPKHYTKPRASNGHIVNYNGPRQGAIHEKIMNELEDILRQSGKAMTSRELQAKSPLIQRRYRSVNHRVAAVTSHMRNMGEDWDIVEVKHPSGSRRALAWYFKKGRG